MDRFGEKVICNPTIKIEKNSECAFINMEMIIPGYKSVHGIADVFDGQSGAKFCDKDILMARITPCLENGKIAKAILPENCFEGYGSTEFLVFRGMENVTDSDYIYYLLRTNYFRQYAVNSMTGASGRQRTDIKFIKKIKWPFPSIDQQRKIAAYLNVYDELIELNLHRISLLERASETIYKEWFVRYRFPGYEDEKFHDGIPSSWEIKRLGDFGHIETGKTPSMKIDDYYGEDVLFIKTPDMHGNTFVLSSEEMLSHEGSASQPKKLLPAKSIMVTCIGTGGVVSINAVPAHTNQQINSIILNDEKCLEWLYLTCKRLKSTIEMYGATGTTMTNLSKGKFSKLKVLVPKRELIYKFNALATPIFDRILLLQKENANLIKQRDIFAERLIFKNVKIDG